MSSKSRRNDGFGRRVPARADRAGERRRTARAAAVQRLRWSLDHAYRNVAHYRAKFDAAGVRPEDLNSLDDLARFPFTTKVDLRETYPFGMFAVPREKVVRVHASSGTTGKPTVVGYTARDIDAWADLMARSIRAAGARPGDIAHVSYGYGLFTGGLGAHYGAERLGLTVIPFGGGQTERQVQLITDFRPAVILVTPSYMLAIADEIERQGLDPRATSLRIGVFGAEPWTNEMRAEIERLAIDAVDVYGLSEVMGPGVACECLETKDGPTIWEGPLLSRRSSTRTPVRSCPTASSANWCSPRCRRKRCRSCATAPATSRGCCRAAHARCAACRRSPGVPTT